MTQDDFNTLQIDDTVCWQNNEQDRGVVTDKGYSAVTIKWADQQSGIYDLERLTQCGIRKIIDK